MLRNFTKFQFNPRSAHPGVFDRFRFLKYKNVLSCYIVEQVPFCSGFLGFRIAIKISLSLILSLLILMIRGMLWYNR